jgi:hypothetical protein
MAKQLWHKWNGESEYFYTLFRIWLELPHHPERPHRRSVREAYARHLGHPLGPRTGAPKEVYKAKRDFDWEGRAAAFDEHLQAKVQEGQDRAVIRGAEKATMERAIDVNRMRVELADFVDEVGPKVRQAIIHMLNDDQAEYSLQALIQAQRLVLDTVKALEAFQSIQPEPEGITDEELERLLGRGETEKGPEGREEAPGDDDAPQDHSDI